MSSGQLQTFDSGGQAIRIRRATLADCPAIAQVQVEGWRTTYRGVVDDDYLESLSVTDRTQKWVENVQVSLEFVKLRFLELRDEFLGKSSFRHPLGCR